MTDKSEAVAKIEISPELQAAIDQQTAQLQAALMETMKIAAEQEAGVTVHWTSMDSAGRMQVEMFVDPELRPDEVRYRSVDPPVAGGA